MTKDVNEQAKAALREFARLYGQLADTYARMLREEGRSSDKKLEFARNRGVAHLVELAERVNVQTYLQVAQVNNMLAGYRQIMESTRELPGCGALLARLPEDAARRLSRLHLTDAPTGE